jgi:hypothetical protein
MTSTPSKATAGPWVYEADETSSGPMFSVYDAFGRRVTDPHVEEQQARLIAAGPTMYDYIAAKAKDGDEDAARIIAAI